VNQVIRALLDVFPLIVPEMILGVAACVLFVGATFRSSRHVWASMAVIALVAAGLTLCYFPGPVVATASEAVYSAPLLLDGMAFLIKAIAIVGGAVLVLSSWDEVPDRQAAEYHGCLLLIVAGLCLTGAANELVTLFLALELISIPTYILLYLPRFDLASQEAAMKYFLLSVFSSAMLLFGFSYLYGLSGTTNVPGLLEALSPRTEPGRLPLVALIGLVMVVAGLGFRITAVPFHYYAPDVYQGAPTGAAALLAFLPKVAGFVALLRVLGFVPPAGSDAVLAMGDQVSVLFWILAAVTMSLGNVLALLQSNLKRLLAYSSVAHAGYMLLGVAVAYYLRTDTSPSEARVPGGVTAVLFYLMAYGAMTVGAFAVLAYLSTPERPVETEDALAGLGQSRPGIALFMALFLFSLIGIPLTAGFLGKLWLFLGALGVEGPNARLFRWLALIMALNAAVGGWYYLRIVSKMYLYPSVHPLDKPRALPGLAALWICALVTLILGIYPGPLLERMDRFTEATRSRSGDPAAPRQARVAEPVADQAAISASAPARQSMSSSVLNGPGLTRTVPSGKVPSER
jgi:NADH-quinone oxidoreductase subunit N